VPEGGSVSGRATRRLSRVRPRLEAGLVIALMLGAALVSWKVLQQIRIGVPWDTYAFLANAARFAGKSIGFDEPARPPVLSALTSLAFRLGPLRVWPIQVVDGLLSFSGIAAMYLVLRRRVEQLPAAMCALGVLALQPVWYWVGQGYSDLAAVALTIWALLFAIKATEDDPRWYAVAFPMLVIASLTRVTALLGVFGVLVWIALRGRPFAHARQIAFGVAAAAVVYVPAGLYYSARFGDILFPYLVNFTLANEQTSRGIVGLGLEPGGWQPLPGIVVIVLAWLAAWGVAALTARALRAERPGGGRILLALAAIALAGAGQAFGALATRQIALLVGVYLTWRALAPREQDGARGGHTTAPAALDAVMLLMLLSYLDFHGHQPVKVWRYVITLAPSAMYFLALGWTEVTATMTRIAGAARAGRDEGATSRRFATAAAWAVAALVLSGLLTVNIATTMRADRDPVTSEAEATADWLKAHEPSPTDLTVYSDVWPLTSWYLGAEARAMPRFPDKRAFAHELSKRRADYYVTLGSEQYRPYFAPAFARGATTVLARHAVDASHRPTMRYLGKAWENYLETVDDFKLDLLYDGGFEGWAGSVFMDAYPATELGRYNAVAVYRVRWYDRGQAEQILGDYLSAGGTVVLDASGNLGGAAYPLLDTILFDTVIRRRETASRATLTASAAFADRHPGLPSTAPGSWMDEGGDPWFGADYAAVPGTPGRETLLSLDGSPVVTLQRVGKGRIYWIGANLMWHAFKMGDARERALVQAVLSEAVERPPLAGPSAGSLAPGAPVR